MYRNRCPVRTGINEFAKSIDSDQPAHFAQADPGRYFFPLVNFLLVSENVLPHCSCPLVYKMDRVGLIILI